MANNVAAKRYAKALFALSDEQKVVESVHADLKALNTLMDHSSEWNTFVHSPFGPLEKRDQLLKEVFGNRTHELTLRFVTFINRKRRIELFPAIYDAWLTLHDETKGILRARVISAAPLSKDHEEALTKKLGARFDKEIILTSGVDESMIGGLKVFIGDHVFDYSIESQLQILQKEMLHA